jgi:hypothetical protein
MRGALWLLLACTACSRPALRLSWVDDAVLRYDPLSYPDDDAVVLHKSDHLMLITRNSEASYVQSGRHEVIALQKEGAFDLAEVKLPLNAKDHFVELKARLKRPNQPWEELDPKSMLSDTSGTGERDLNARFFRFPGIELGTLLEYYYIIETSHLWMAADQDTVGRYPVRQYQFGLEASKELVITTTAYNSKFPIRSEILPSASPLAGHTNRLSCEIRDIPHRPLEDFAPDWTFTEPRWAWRILAFDYGNQVYTGWSTWNHVLESRAADYYGAKGELFAGYSARLDVEGCTDVACKVARARAFVLLQARNKALGPLYFPRPMKDVLETKTASVVERAVLMRRLLADAGVDARLAYATRHWSQQTDPSFPDLSRFNDLLIYLPAQPGLPGGGWLLPRCDYCGLNQLPAELRGLDALVFRAESRGPVVEPLVESEWRSTLDSQPARPSRTVYHHQARLEGEGMLDDAFRETTEGLASVPEELLSQAQTPSERLSAERSAVAARAALGKLLGTDPRTCNAEQGVCQLGKHFAIPVYATAESDQRWLVPLNALALNHSSTLKDPKSKRVADLHFQNQSEFEETFELEAPAGFVLESAPKQVSGSSPLVQSTLKIEATAKGARVTRTLKQSIGGVPLAQYEQTRNAFRVFQDARHLVLSFVKK